MAPKCVLWKADPQTDGVLNERMRSYFPFQFGLRKPVGLIFCIQGRLRWPQGSVSFQRNKRKWASITAVEFEVRCQPEIPTLRTSCQSVDRFQNRLWNLLPWRQLKIGQAATCLTRVQPFQEAGYRTKPFLPRRESTNQKCWSWQGKKEGGGRAAGPR